jgi:GTPase
VYQIGVEDDGNPLGITPAEMEASLGTLRHMAEVVGCSMAVSQLFAGKIGLTAEVLLRRRQRLALSPVQVLVAVAGDADAGKSTLIAVLCCCGGALDNGRGLARTQVGNTYTGVQTVDIIPESVSLMSYVWWHLICTHCPKQPAVSSHPIAPAVHTTVSLTAFRASAMPPCL